MQIIDVEQGSDEWLEARRGIPTASEFSKLVTSTGKASTQANDYINLLISERLGAVSESFTNEWMERGVELESAARAWYAFQTEIEPTQVGFVLNDAGTAGASPDAIFDGGGLEIKCPSPKVHISYLRANKCPAAYIGQVQGCMWICERETWDFLSFHPELPPLLVKVARDEDYIAKLSQRVTEITETINSELNKIRGLM